MKFEFFHIKNDKIRKFPFSIAMQQGIFILVAGFFRLPNDLPKAVWRYPMSYIGFHMYALQVREKDRGGGIVFPSV